jgi:hypothetical protein
MLTAIVGILLGNVLITTMFAPALQRLREIIGRVADIQLPFRNSLLGAPPLSAEQRGLLEETTTNDFNRFFREYVMSFNAFKKVGVVFVTAIIILACVVAWGMPMPIESRLMWMVLSVFTIVGTGYYLQRTVAPTPSHLLSIDYLQNNYANLHLSSLFDCSRVRVNFVRDLLSTDPEMHFSMSQGLMFLGHRFLFVVSDPECTRVYFVAYGQLGAHINFQQIYTPEIKSFSIPLGHFCVTDTIRNKQLLRFHLWLFVPTPKGWAKEVHLHPRILSDEVSTIVGGNFGFIIPTRSCSWRSSDENVEFERKSSVGFESWRITRVTMPTPNCPQAILAMFKDKIEHCRRIESQEHPSGIGVGEAE